MTCGPISTPRPLPVSAAKPGWKSLIENWTRQGRISSQSSPAAERKIEFLTSSFSERRRLSLNDLSDRSSMLADLRAQVALMKRDLADLARYLRAAGW